MRLLASVGMMERNSQQIQRMKRIWGWNPGQARNDSSMTRFRRNRAASYRFGGYWTLLRHFISASATASTSDHHSAVASISRSSMYCASSLTAGHRMNHGAITNINSHSSKMLPATAVHFLMILCLFDTLICSLLKILALY